MGDIINNGSIKFNKALTNEAIDLLSKEFQSLWEKDYLEAFETGVDTAEILEYQDKDMFNTVKRTVNILAPLGYILNGSLPYYGDDEGTTYITNNIVRSYDIDDRWQMDASDEALITILKKRGYVVAKEKTGTLNQKLFKEEYQSIVELTKPFDFMNRDHCKLLRDVSLDFNHSDFKIDDDINGFRKSLIDYNKRILERDITELLEMNVENSSGYPNSFKILVRNYSTQVWVEVNIKANTVLQFFYELYKYFVAHNPGRHHYFEGIEPTEYGVCLLRLGS